VSGINADIIDSSRRTALDIVREQKTHKAVEIAKLIAGNFIVLQYWSAVVIIGTRKGTIGQFSYDARQYAD